MKLGKILRKTIKFPLHMLLGWEEIRKRVIYEIKQRYYSELGVNLTIGGEMMCPICFPEAAYSFSEVFVMKEYEKVFNLIPVPDRWIDLGCYCGYFSLYLAQLRDKEKRGSEMSAFLLDGYSRATEAVEKLDSCGYGGGELIFRQGVIAEGKGERTFIERPNMASSLGGMNSSPGKRTKVRVTTATDIIKEFPPPYDLIKADIEGAERYLLEHYESVLKEARYLMLEWHPSAGEEKDLLLLAEKRGFRLLGRWGASGCGGCALLVFENTLMSEKK